MKNDAGQMHEEYDRTVRWDAGHDRQVLAVVVQVRHYWEQGEHVIAPEA